MSSLADEEIERYGRQIIVPGVGGAGQEKLKGATIACVGAGGLGSPALLYLASAGVGRLRVIDGDLVDATNLQRQIAHGTPDLGRNKAESAAETLRELNPLIEVETHSVRIDSENAFELLHGADVVIDGSDNFPTRYLVNDACVMLGIPLVTAAILRFSGQITVVVPREGPCYRCVFPEPPEAGAVPSCAQAGILGPVAGVMGSLQALEAMKIVIGLEGVLTGRYLAFDMLAGECHVMEIERDAGCPVCGDDPVITELQSAPEVCGR